MKARIGIRLQARQLQPQAAIPGDALVDLLNYRGQGVALGLHVAW
jgi:hypothetical protein